MRVFILCTGRNGSTAIIRACQHISNYSAAHESLSRKFGSDRFDYPDDHIEADNRLSWHLGQLHSTFGDQAVYIHLHRNKDKVAKSLLKRFYLPTSIMDAYCEGVHMLPPEKMSEAQRLQACYEYIDTVNQNIELFLKDKTQTLRIDLESIEPDFKRMWAMIGAKGNLEEALMEFKTSHNASQKRKLSFGNRIKLYLIREWRHIKMSIRS